MGEGEEREQQGGEETGRESRSVLVFFVAFFWGQTARQKESREKHHFARFDYNPITLNETIQ